VATSQAKTQPCTLTGRDLFLIEAASADAAFTQAANVPSGFTGSTLAVPRPVEGKLYLRLRDAPAMPVILPQP